MQVQVRQILNSSEALRRLMANPFPLKLSYKLSRILASIEREMDSFYKARDLVIKQLDAKNPKWREDEDATLRNQWAKELDEMMTEEITIWGDVVKAEVLGEIAISPSDLFLLDWLIEFEEKAATQTA